MAERELVRSELELYFQRPDESIKVLHLGGSFLGTWVKTETTDDTLIDISEAIASLQTNILESAQRAERYKLTRTIEE